MNAWRRLPWTGQLVGIYVLLAIIVLTLGLLNPAGDPFFVHLKLTTVDNPRLPNDAVPTPIIGQHYFGDWQLYVAWLADANPYRAEGSGMQALPPSFIFLKPIALLPLPISLATIMLVGFGLTLTAHRCLLPNRSWWFVGATWMLAYPFAAGGMAAIDRGSLQPWVIGLAGWGLAALRQGRPVLTGVCWAVAIFIKPYMIFLLLIPLAARNLRLACFTLSGCAFLSTLGFAVLPGGLWSNLVVYAHALQGYTNETSLNVFLHSYSLGGLLLHLPAITLDPMASSSVIRHVPLQALLVPGILWLAVVTRETFRLGSANIVCVCLVLSTTQLVLPSSQEYTTMWAGLGATLILGQTQKPTTPAERLSVIGIALALLPLPFTFVSSERSIPLAAVLVPIAWSFVALLARAQTEADDVHRSTAHGDAASPGNPGSVDVAETGARPHGLSTTPRRCLPTRGLASNTSTQPDDGTSPN